MHTNEHFKNSDNANEFHCANENCTCDPCTCTEAECCPDGKEAYAELVAKPFN